MNKEGDNINKTSNDKQQLSKPADMPVWLIVKRECSVQDCDNNSSKTKIFAFPKCTTYQGRSYEKSNLERCKMWLKACGNESLLELDLSDIHKNAFVCSVHFEANQFKDDAKEELNATSLPTLHLPLPLPAEKLEDLFACFPTGATMESENGIQCPTNGANLEDCEIPVLKQEGNLSEEELQDGLPTNGEYPRMPVLFMEEARAPNPKPFRCTTCSKRFGDAYTLETHWKVVHCDDGPMDCSLCDKTFLRSCDYKRHSRIHTTKMRYVCTECERCFPNKALYTKHIRTSHSEGSPFYCAPCNRRFASGGCLKSHLRTHSGEKHYGCNLCDKRFFTNSALKEHRLTHSGGKCKLCGEIYPDRNALKAHVKEHEKDTPFPCIRCHRRFSEQKHLIIHLRTHSGVACFKCKDCNKRCPTQESLKAHMKTHLEDELVICPLCKGKFSNYNRLIHHWCKSGRLTKRYCCPVCGQQFSSQSVLDAHSHIHDVAEEPEKPYGCSECYKRFLTKTRLDSHIRTQHGGSSRTAAFGEDEEEELEDSKVGIRNYSLEERLESVERSVGAMEEDSESVERSVSAMEEDLESVERSVGAMEEDSESVERSVGAMEEDLESVERSVGAMEEDLESGERSMGAVEDDLESVERSVGAVEEDLESVERSMGAVEEDSESVERSVGAVEDDSESVERSVGAVEDDSESVERSVGAVEEDSESVERSVGAGEEDSESVERSVGAVEEDSESVERSVGAMAEDSETVGNDTPGVASNSNTDISGPEDTKRADTPDEQCCSDSLGVSANEEASTL